MADRMSFCRKHWAMVPKEKKLSIATAWALILSGGSKRPYIVLRGEIADSLREKS